MKGGLTTLLLMLVPAFTAVAEEDTIPVSALTDVLISCSEQLRQVSSRVDPGCSAEHARAIYREAMISTERQLRQLPQVRIPRGSQSIQPSFEWLSQHIRVIDEATDRDRLNEVLDAFIEDLEACSEECVFLEKSVGLGRVPGEDEVADAHARLVTIVNREEFRRHYQMMDPWQELWGKILQWLTGLLAALGLPAWLLPVLQWVAIGLAAGGLIFIVINLVRQSGGPTRARVDDVEAMVVRLETPGQYYRLARQEKEAGNYRTSLRFLYLALIAELVQIRLLSHDKSKTNWEYVSMLREEGAGRQELDIMRDLSITFERKWYGSDDCASVEVERFEELSSVALSKFRRLAPST